MTSTTVCGRRIQAAILALVVSTTLLGLAGEARASHQPSCGETITHSVTLTGPVGPCPGDGIIIGADGITLDLNGHSISGLPGVPQVQGTGAGVLVENHTGVTVKNGTVQFFDGGVVLRQGGDHTLTGLEVTANVGTLVSQWGEGIGLWESDGNTVDGNVVSLNGPYAGIGLYGDLTINGSDDNIVKNNEVVTNLTGPTEVIGIRLEPYAEGNMVADNTVTGSRLDGIAVFFGSTGNDITGNTISASGRDGVRLWDRTSGNTVSGNTSTNNANFDLYDHHGHCNANTWSGNTYGTKSPACIN